MPKPLRIGNIYGDNRGTGFAGNVWHKEGIAPTLTTMGGGNREPIIVEIVRYAESSRGKESTLTLGADFNGTHPQPSVIQALKTCQKH